MILVGVSATALDETPCISSIISLRSSKVIRSRSLATSASEGVEEEAMVLQLEEATVVVCSSAMICVCAVRLEGNACFVSRKGMLVGIESYEALCAGRFFRMEGQTPVHRQQLENLRHNTLDRCSLSHTQSF